MEVFPWEKLLEVGPLYPIIGVLAYLLIRQMAAIDKLKDAITQLCTAITLLHQLTESTADDARSIFTFVLDREKRQDR